MRSILQPFAAPTTKKKISKNDGPNRGATALKSRVHNLTNTRPQTLGEQKHVHKVQSTVGGSTTQSTLVAHRKSRQLHHTHRYPQQSRVSHARHDAYAAWSQRGCGDPVPWCRPRPREQMGCYCRRYHCRPSHCFRLPFLSAASHLPPCPLGRTANMG